MTGDEYLYNLTKAAPKNVPTDYLVRSGTLIVSKSKWGRLRAELWRDLRRGAAGVQLCGYMVGLVDVDDVEQLVPDDSAIAYLDVGDYVIRRGKLYQVTYVNGRANCPEGRCTDIMRVSDITSPV